jgi:hypothetical protein
VYYSSNLFIISWYCSIFRKPQRWNILYSKQNTSRRRWQLQLFECHSNWEGGNEAGQSESSLAISHTISIPFDMAFWDWSCRFRIQYTLKYTAMGKGSTNVANFIIIFFLWGISEFGRCRSRSSISWGKFFSLFLSTRAQQWKILTKLEKVSTVLLLYFSW